jgi:flagellar L-ring protein precursor FlgH
MFLLFTLAFVAFSLAQQAPPANPQGTPAAADTSKEYPKLLITGNTSQTPGGMWEDTKVRMLVGMEGNARNIGDLITIVITEQTSSQLQADTTTRKESTITASIGSLLGLKQKLIKANPNLGAELGIDTSSGTSFQGDGNTSRAGALQGVLTCRVVEVQANGNLVVFGWKEVRSNKETQYLSLSGVVRPQDIRNDNTIPSDLIAEARIEYTGTGVVAEKQAPGVGTRIVDTIWPF